MRLQRLDITDASVLEDNVAAIAFGKVYQGCHSESSIALRVMPDEGATFLNCGVFIGASGAYPHAHFGFGTSDEFIPNVPAGGALLSKHLGFTSADTLNVDASGFFWLDVQASLSDITTAARTAYNEREATLAYNAAYKEAVSSGSDDPTAIATVAKENRIVELTSTDNISLKFVYEYQ